MEVDAGLVKTDITKSFNPIWDRSHVGIAVLDDHLRYVAVNAFLAEINGVPVERHLGKCLGDVLGDMAQTVESAIKDVFNTGEPALNVDIVGELPARQGNPKHWKANYFPVNGPNGQVKQVAAMVVELRHPNVSFPAGPETAAAHGAPTDRLLRSWKEIANYLGACVKTVQRWEEFHSLPVRRVTAKKGATVFAFTPDLDTWMRSRAVDDVARKQMRQVFVGFPVPALVLNNERVIVEANDKAIQALRISGEQLIGTLLDSLLSTSTSAYNNGEWEAFAQTGMSAGARNLVRRDGSTFSAEYVIKRVGPGANLFTFTVVRTQTRRRAAVFYEVTPETYEPIGTIGSADVPS